MKRTLNRLLGIAREPLIQFLATGAALFAIFGVIDGPTRDSADDRTIVVDRRALLTFMQYRSNAFQPELFRARLDAMSPEQKRHLVNDYIHEETLYREAKALGLGQNDYVIRRRLVQTMEFLMENVASTDTAPKEAALAQYFQEHQDQYAVASSWTFTHVFFDASVRGTPGAQAAAERTLSELNASSTAFNDAPRYGDRFPYLQNYVERTSDYVENHFGEEFLGRLSAMQPSPRTWKGPLRSKHGYHLVLLTHHTTPRLPQLDEVRDRVEDDFKRDRLEQARDRAIDALSRRYDVRMADLSMGGRHLELPAPRCREHRVADDLHRSDRSGC